MTSGGANKLSAIDLGLIVETYSHLSNKRDVTLTDFGKFHPAHLLISLQNFQYSNLMKIFLTVILSYKSLFLMEKVHFCTPTRLFQPPQLLER